MTSAKSRKSLDYRLFLRSHLSVIGAGLIGLASAAALQANEPRSGSDTIETPRDDMQKLSEELQTAVNEVLNRRATVIKFAPGSATLSEDSKTSLRALLSAVRGRVTRQDAVKTSSPKKPQREITTVAAWSDSPPSPETMSSGDRAGHELANTRGAAIARLLGDLGASNVRVLNMAEPALQEPLERSEILQLLSNKGGPSKAVVHIAMTATAAH